MSFWSKFQCHGASSWWVNMRRVQLQHIFKIGELCLKVDWTPCFWKKVTYSISSHFTTSSCCKPYSIIARQTQKQTFFSPLKSITKIGTKIPTVLRHFCCKIHVAFPPPPARLLINLVLLLFAMVNEWKLVWPALIIPTLFFCPK